MEDLFYGIGIGGQVAVIGAGVWVGEADVAFADVISGDKGDGTFEFGGVALGFCYADGEGFGVNVGGLGVVAALDGSGQEADQDDCQQDDEEDITAF